MKKYKTYYQDIPPHHSFKISYSSLEHFYKKLDYYEICEACIDDMHELVVDLCSPNSINCNNTKIKFNLDDSHDNKQFHLLYFDITGIDSATSGLIENEWQKRLNYQGDILYFP